MDIEGGNFMPRLSIAIGSALGMVFIEFHHVDGTQHTRFYLFIIYFNNEVLSLARIRLGPTFYQHDLFRSSI